MVDEQQGVPPQAEPADTLLHDDLMAEYFKLVDIVSNFDQRLLTIKSWGVTLGLASLGLGFQQDHYGLFLVAATSGFAFWILEGITKTHQMRHYPRMGDIEVAAAQLYAVETESGPVSAPRIDWSWYTAGPRLRGGQSKGDPDRPQRWPSVNESPGRHPLTFPHTLFPHAISVLVGLVLFLVGLAGQLGPI